MKRMVLLLCCLMLVSCGKKQTVEDYFLYPRILEITFTQGDVSIDGKLETSAERIVFYPNSPEGLSIVVDSNGGEARYGDLVFNGVSQMSRLTSFYSQMTDGSLKLTYNQKSYPETVEGKDFKITVHKEINK